MGIALVEVVIADLGIVDVGELAMSGSTVPPMLSSPLAVAAHPSFTSAPDEEVVIGTEASGLTTWVFAEGRAGLPGHWACAEYVAR